MASLTFNTAPILDFDTGKTYYVLPVVQFPLVTQQTVGDTSVLAGSVPTYLTGEIKTPGYWTFDDVIGTEVVSIIPVYGFVVVQQIGPDPSNNDRLVNFSTFNDTLVDFVLPPGAYSINITFVPNYCMIFGFGIFTINFAEDTKITYQLAVEDAPEYEEATTTITKFSEPLEPKPPLYNPMATYIITSSKWPRY